MFSPIHLSHGSATNVRTSPRARWPLRIPTPGHPCTYHCVIEGKRRILPIGGSCTLGMLNKPLNQKKKKSLNQCESKRQLPPIWRLMHSWVAQLASCETVRARGDPPKTGGHASHKMLRARGKASQMETDALLGSLTGLS